MHQFYFNECYSSDERSLPELSTLLSATIREYTELIKKKIGIVKGVVLEKESGQVVICGNSLKEIIMSIPNKDRETRTLAFAYFTKYPIQDHLPTKEMEDHLLTQEFNIGKLDAANLSTEEMEGNLPTQELLDATNLAVAKYNSCFIFSIAVDDSIKNNTLVIKGKSEELVLDNLFGEADNTVEIEFQIRKINNASLGLFDQLKAELRSWIFTTSFEKSFLAATDDVQNSIIELFRRARARSLTTPYFPDTEIIKDVTPSKNSTSARVYELRVTNPLALRVYFYEYGGSVFVSGLEYKSKYKESNGSAQSVDIKTALKNIDNLIKTK